MTNTHTAPASTGYVIYDTQKTAIYGAAATVDAAWRQVMDETDRPTNAFTDEPVSDDEWFSGFRVSGASQALIDMVNEIGGDLAWQAVNGVACTEAEYEAAHA
jgi:hypothetical protein